MQQGKEPGMLLQDLVAVSGVTALSLAISGILRIMISVTWSAQFYLLQVSYCCLWHEVFCQAKQL